MTILRMIVCVAAGCVATFSACYALDLQKLAPDECRTVDSILLKTKSKLETMKSQNINPNWLEISDLKSGLTRKEKKFVQKIIKLKPADLGANTPKQMTQKMSVAYQTLASQPVFKDGKPLEFLAPLVSLPTYEAYEKMMQAMEKEIGKRFYIESGHRSQGYHLYNFLKYLREHQYSLMETGKLNALPGYSEHNVWVHHAIDLISAEGINGDPKPEEYENLPEHQWMLKHASEYGFELSYPRGNPHGISFEPWHWRQTRQTTTD